VNRERLVKALVELRAKIVVVEHMLDTGDDAGALAVLAEAEDKWAAALEEIRS